MNAIEFINLLGLTHGEVLNSGVVRKIGAADLEVTEHTAAMEYPQRGFSIAFEKANWTTRRVDAEQFVVVGVHVFLSPIGGYEPFEGDLLHGLTPSSSRDVVRRALWLPAASGGGKRGMFNRWIDCWDRFDLGDYSLTVEYRGEGIKLLAIMAPADAKGFT
jgi:hypothetical protein